MLERRAFDSVPETFQEVKELKEEQNGELDSSTKQIIEELYKSANHPVLTLSDEDNKKIEVIRELSHKTYGTLTYDKLYSYAKDIFCADGVKYRPHTVGSYFIGCSVKTNIKESTQNVNPGCSVLCAGSLPVPKSLIDKDKEQWGFCSQNVIWCLSTADEYQRKVRISRTITHGMVEQTHLADNPTYLDRVKPEDQVFEFSFLTHISASTKALLFVNYNSYEEFPGFTEREKSRLINHMGVTDVKLLSYNMDGTNYKDLVGNPIKVFSLKTRTEGKNLGVFTKRDENSPQVRSKANAKIILMGLLSFAIVFTIIIYGFSKFYFKSNIEASPKQQIRRRQRMMK